MGLRFTDRVARNRWSAGIAAALLASTALTCGSLVLSTPASAQTAQASYSIPGGPLNRALAAFGRQSGLQVVYVPAIAAGKSSPGLSGAASPAQAVAGILQGTGLTYSFPDSRTVSITAPSPSAAAGSLPAGAISLDTIDVQGGQKGLPAEYAGGQVATGGQVGMLGNRNVMDTPFNQTSYTAKRIQNVQAQTVRDVLQDDPSVRAVNSTNNPSADSYQIRGLFVPGINMAFGGMYGIVPVSTLGAQLAERVEVLKGPSALINGMPPTGTVAGAINVVPKRADDTPLTQLTTSYRSNSTFGQQVDVGRRFGDNKEFGVRFNGAYTGGNTEVDDQGRQFGLAALGLDYRGERVRLSFDLGYQKDHTNNLTNQAFLLAPGVPMPAAPRGSRNFSQPWTYTDGEDLFGVARGEVDLTENITVFGGYGMRTSSRDSLATGVITITDPYGTTAANAQENLNQLNATSAQVGLRSEFSTGPLKHRVVVEADRLTNDTNLGISSFTSITSNLYSPIFQTKPILTIPKLGKSGETTLSGVAIADTVSFFDDRILVTGGVRKQEINQKNFIFTTNALFNEYTADALSPAVAVVVKPWQNVSLYANYIEGLQPGQIVTSQYSNAGAVLPPFHAKQTEAGVKVDWGKLVTTVSAFEINQPSLLIDSSTLALTQNGEQLNRGVEFNFFGEITEGLRVLGGAMYIDPRLTKTAGGLDDGKIAAATPRFQANLAVDWDTPFINGLTLTGRAIYTGSQYIETASPQRIIPDWTRYDVGARYTFQREGGQPVTIRFAVENVLDTNYWASNGFTLGLVAGTGRTYALSTTFNF